MGIRVLVVDDDKDLLTLIERFLVKEHQDFEVTSTISAQDAVRKLEDEHFDAIVCDYYLGVGEMNGLELLEWLRASHSTMPFIMFTGRSREEVAIRALNLGADLYLKKDQEDLGNLFVELAHHIKSSVESAQIEKTLWEERSRFQKYLDVAGIMIVALDSNGTITLMNRKGCEILGYDSKEVVGKDWFKTFIPKSLRKEVYRTFTSLMKGDIEPVKHFENPIITNNGEERIIAWHNSVLIDESGMITGTLGSGEDITERRRAEEALRQSEHRYHDLLMTLPEGIGITDLNENFTYVNQAFSDMLDYTVEELVQKNVLDLTTADGHRKVKAETERRKNHASSTYELQMIRKDGELRLFNISTLPQKDDEGNVIGTIGVVSDITEHKKAEKALRASEQLLKSTFDSLSEAILVIEADTAEIVNCNPAAETVFGYSRYEMLGQKISMLHVDETALERFEANLYPAIEENGILDRFEFRMRRSDGTVFPTEHRVTQLKNDQGTRVGWVTVIRDITAYKRGEEKLRGSEERYRVLVETMNDGLGVIDENERFTFVNTCFAEMLGYSPEEMTEQLISDFVDGNNLNILTENMMKRREGFSSAYELIWSTKTGEKVISIVSGRSLLDRDGNYRGSFAVITNITEQKQAYESLKQQKKELSDFAHTMSHDLNSYFFKIRSSILLLGTKGELPEIHGIKLLIEEMSELVQHSVVLADAGLTIDKKEEVNLARLVRDIADRHLPGGIALVEGPLQFVMADEIKLLQIFQNLFRNAVEHGSPTTVEVQRYDSEEGIRIVVSNNGKPIPNDLRPNIFQRGFTTKVKGKGYGLSIIKKLVEAHGWQIKLADTPETAFEILIPTAAG